MKLIDYQNDNSYNTKELNQLHPQELKQLVKRTARNYDGPDKINLFCSCCRPKQDESIQYSIIKNEKGTYFARPYHNNRGIGHSLKCLKHPSNHDYRTTNPILDEDENGNQVIHTRVNFAAPPRRNQNPGEPRNRRRAPRADERTGMLRSVHELYSTINEWMYYYHLDNGHYEEEIGKICHNPLRFNNFKKYLMSQNLGIQNVNKPLQEYSIEEDGYAFVYAKVERIFDKAVEWGDDKYVKIYLENDQVIQIHVWFYRLLKERFSGYYSGNTMETNSKKYALVLAGSYRLENNDYYLNKGTFLMVSPKYGLAVDSVHEAQFYDAALDIICTDKKYRDVLFYKPCRFIPCGVYTGKLLPDAILTSKRNEQECIIEIFGSQDPKYMQTWQKKEKWAASHSDTYDFLSWDVCDKNDSLEAAIQRFERLVERYRVL